MGDVERVIEELYADNARKLHWLCDKKLKEFGGISQKDYDDFYSRANYEITLARNSYAPDSGKSFMEYISGVIHYAVMKEVDSRNRDKRRVNALAASMETPVGDGGMVLSDFLVSDFNMEETLLETTEGHCCGRVEAYLESLSEVQRQIVKMKLEEKSVSEIKEKLKLTTRQYESQMQGLKAFSKINLLYSRNNHRHTRHNVRIRSNMGRVTQTMEKSKPDRLSIASIIKKMDRRTIRFDHPLQRESEQWSPSMKGNLIADILQGNPIPALVFAEQIVNDVAVIWDLDGKQRCTNAYSFSKDGFRITRNIRRYMIAYQAPVLDGNGDGVSDENHIPLFEKKEFDIRGKKFSELPEELRDRFWDYNFEIVQYLNCSGEDIAYHIARYNEGKPMTVSQKGITRLGEEYAEMVKNISGMSFFKDLGGYKVSGFKNGTITRVVVEGIMASFFLDNWKKKQEDMCDFIRCNAVPSHFDGFKEMICRLEKVVTKETACMFDVKDSFLWFGLFARFSRTNADDKKFTAFMEAFSETLHKKKVGGVSFDSLNAKATKDKSVVIAKMTCLEKLLYAHLNQI